MRIQSIQPPSHVYAKRGPVAINDPQDNASILYNKIWHLVICTNQGSVVINYLVDNSTPQPIAISHSKLLAMQTLEQHKWKWKNQGEILFKLSDAKHCSISKPEKSITENLAIQSSLQLSQFI